MLIFYKSISRQPIPMVDLIEDSCDAAAEEAKYNSLYFRFETENLKKSCKLYEKIQFGCIFGGLVSITNYCWLTRKSTTANAADTQQKMVPKNNAWRAMKYIPYGCLAVLGYTVYRRIQAEKRIEDYRNAEEMWDHFSRDVQYYKSTLVDAETEREDLQRIEWRQQFVEHPPRIQSMETRKRIFEELEKWRPERKY